MSRSDMVSSRILSGSKRLERTAFVKRAPELDVVRGKPQENGIIVVVSEPGVAPPAEQAAELPGVVAVIDDQPLFGFSRAECAEAALPREHLVVLLQRQP